MAGASIRGSAPQLVRRMRAGRPRSGAPPIDGGDWPHTRRALPWLLAGFLGMLCLIPFDALQLPVQLPFDSKFDRVFLVVIVIAWAASLMGARAAAPRFVRNPLATPILLFLFVALFTIAVNLPTIARLDELDLSVKKLALLSSYVAFFFIVATVVRPSEARAFTVLLVGLAALSAVGTIWEYRTGFNAFYEWSAKLLPGFSLQGGSTGIDAIGRRTVIGPTQHGLAITTLLSLAFPFALLGVLRSKERRKKLLYGGAAAVIAAGTFATARKTAVFVPVATVLVLVLYRPRDMLRLAPLGLLLVPAIHLLAPAAIGSIRQQLFPEQGFFSQGTVEARKSDWDAVQPDIRKHMAFGRGWGTYDPKRNRTLDNQYLGLLIEVGFVGLGAYALMLLSLAWFAHPVIRSGDPIRGPPALAAASAAIGLAVASALFDVLAFPQVPYAFMFMAGLMVATRAKSPTLPRPESSERLYRTGEDERAEGEQDWLDRPAGRPIGDDHRRPRRERAPAPSVPGAALRRGHPERSAGGGARERRPAPAQSASPPATKRSDRSGARAPAAAGGLRGARTPRRRIPARVRGRHSSLDGSGRPMLAVAAIAVCAVAGLLAGRLSSEPKPGAIVRTVRTAGLELSAPAGWRAARVAPPGESAIGLVKPIELAPKSGPRGAGLIAGRTDIAGPGLLPAALLGRLAGPPPRPGLVRLGALSAYRYRAVHVRQDRRTLTLYATPTTAGAALIGCFAPPGADSFLADCERVASSLALVRLAPVPLEPSPSYKRLLDRTVEQLNQVRATQRTSLRQTRTPRGQARAASALARAYALAAASVADAPAGPVQRPANARLVVALRQAASGYSQLASAARQADRGAFAQARQAVGLRDSALQRALAGVNTPGASG